MLRGLRPIRRSDPEGALQAVLPVEQPIMRAMSRGGTALEPPRGVKTPLAPSAAVLLPAAVRALPAPILSAPAAEGLALATPPALPAPRVALPAPIAAGKAAPRALPAPKVPPPATEASGKATAARTLRYAGGGAYQSACGLKRASLLKGALSTLHPDRASPPPHSLGEELSVHLRLPTA